MNVFLDIYLENNLGDDLFLELMLQRYSQHTFYIYTSNHYDEFAKQYSNLKIIKPNKILNYMAHKLDRKNIILEKVIKKYQIQACVVIGGSIFIEYDGWEKLYNERLKLWTFLNKQDIGVFIIGSNFGPSRTQGFIEKYKEIFSLVDNVCFRDQSSFNIFSELENVSLAPDPVFSMKIKTNEIQENTVGISVINLKNRSELSSFQDDYITYLKNCIVFWKEMGKDVYLLSFCNNEGDNEAIELIINSLNGRYSVKTLCYDGNVSKFLNEFSKIESVLATRFHSIVLSLLYRKKVSILNYSQKSENLIRDNNMGVEMNHIRNVNKLSPQNTNFKFSDSNKVESLIDSSKHQFIAFEQYIDNRKS